MSSIAFRGSSNGTGIISFFLIHLFGLLIIEKGHSYSFIRNVKSHPSTRRPSSPHGQGRGVSSAWRFDPSMRGKRSSMKMSLTPIPADNLRCLLSSSLPTSAQYASYWGKTTRERSNALFEAAGFTFLGVFGSYFISFVIGSPLATLTGAVSAFWVLLGPEVKAYQRNWELRGGADYLDWDAADAGDVTFGYDGYDGFDFDDGKEGLYGAYYVGRVVHVSVVDGADRPSGEGQSLDRFWDYTMESDENEKITGLPYQIRLRVEDCRGRLLQIHARMSEEYLDVDVGMTVVTVLLSEGKDFKNLAALADFYVVDVDCWVGDYPYLDRTFFLNQELDYLEDELEVESGENDEDAFAYR